MHLHHHGSRRWLIAGSLAFSLILPFLASDTQVAAAGSPEMPRQTSATTALDAAPTLTADAVGALGAGDSADVIPLLPARLLETRPNETTVDGLEQGAGPVGPGIIEVDIVGRGGVPTPSTGIDVTAAMLNISAVSPTTNGYITMFPCGEPPTASSLNYTTGQVAIANEVLAKLSPQGTVCAYAHTAVDLLIDVTGYIPTNSNITPLLPARLLETRPNETTVDGLEQGAGPVGPGIIEVDIVGRGGVPTPSTGIDVTAAMLNISAVSPTTNGYITMFPCGEPPTASSLNYTTGQVAIANEVLAKLSPQGTVCAYAHTAVDLLIDVTGYIPTNSNITPLLPARLLETRPNETTVDGLEQGAGPVGPGIIEVDIVGRGGVPTPSTGIDVTAAMLNISAVSPTTNGYITMFPCGEPPTASSLNYTTGQVAIANEVLAKLSPQGTVCAYAHTAVDLLIDVTGYIPTNSSVIPVGAITDTVHEQGWFAEPAAVTLTRDGQTGSFSLVHYGTDGLPSGLPVPAGVTLNRPSPEFDITPLGTGEFQVAASDTIDSEIFGFVIPGVDEPVVTSVSSVRYADGWQLLDESEVVFPPPVGTTVDSVAPFTPAEFAARADDATGQEKQPHVPIVLVGAAPPLGARLANNLVAGTVIEPAGAPSLERDGMALVTIEIPQYNALFSEVAFRLDYGELTDAGLTEVADGFTCLGTAPEDPECSPPTAGAFARPDASPVPQRLGSSFLEAKEGTANPCEATAALELGEVKASITYSMENRSVFDWDYSKARNQGFLWINPIVNLKAKADLSAKIAPTGKITIACELPLATPEFEVPGPTAPLFTAALPLSAHFDVEGQAAPGLALAQWSYSCTRERRISVGGIVLYPELTVENKNDGGTWTGDCPQPTAPTMDDGWTSGIGEATNFSVKAWLYPQVNAGVRVGGRITRVAGKIVGNDNLGLVTPFVLKFGPSLNFAYESAGAVLAAEPRQHSSGVTFQLEGEASLDIPLFDWLFEKLFEGFPDSVTFPNPSISIASDSVQIVGLGDSGPPTITTNGAPNGAPNDGVVAIGDAVKVAFPEIASSGLLDVQLDKTVYVYEPRGDGQYDDRTLWFATTVTGNTVSLDLIMDDQTCRDLFWEQRSFVVLGYGGLAGPKIFPAYVGSFDLQCGGVFIDSGTVAQNGAHQTPIAISDVAGGNAVVSQDNREAVSWQLDITGTGADRISVNPSTGTFDSDTGEVPITVSIDCTATTSGFETGRATLSLTTEGTPSGQVPIDWLCGSANVSAGLLVAVPEQVPLNSSFTIFSVSHTPVDWSAYQYINPWVLWSCAIAGNPRGCLDAPFDVSPSDGTLAAGVSHVAVELSFPTEPVPVCFPTEPGPLQYYGQLLINSGSLKIEIGWPPTTYIQADDCDPPAKVQRVWRSSHDELRRRQVRRTSARRIRVRRVRHRRRSTRRSP